MTNLTAPASAIWFDLKPIGTADLIAILAALIAFAAFATALLFSRSARKDALRVEKSGAYLSLEVASAIEAEAARREMRWIFLESGVANLGAHGFFERHGFSLTSHTFAKQL
ncbi:hypothetical protein BH11PSE6_BH11PSE6_21190 [soil metagenome]